MDAPTTNNGRVIVSDTKYILIYPFESQERAFEVANDIDGSLMWNNGTAYPSDNIPAFIVPLSEFNSRWVAPDEIADLQKQNAALQADADRYRVLRNSLVNGKTTTYMPLVTDPLRLDKMVTYLPEGLDNVLDMAIKEFSSDQRD
jgi:hypothetical protein